MNAPRKPIDILLVEDDPGHRRLIEKWLRRANFADNILICVNGQDAFNLLFQEGEPALTWPTRRSLLILLDLNMPEISGYQVLTRLKSDAHTQPIPIIILTTVFDPDEVRRCYELGCNLYITKPVDYDEFSQVISRLGLFVSVLTIPTWSPK